MKKILINIFKEIKTLVTIFVWSIFGFLAVAMAYIRLPKFGGIPKGKRLERIEKSPNYENGKFKNLAVTTVVTGKSSFFKTSRDRIQNSNPNKIPKEPLPTIKTDLMSLPKDEDVLIWFGHSSLFVQLDGKRILFDPVFSKSVSPVPFGIKRFKGTGIYKPEELPDIDYLFISHDHWDHLDYKTMISLRDRVGAVICGLGVGEHLERWGFSAEKIIELDWWEEHSFGDITVYGLPARHFSGRTFNRNKSLWMSFLIKTKTLKLYHSGDGGYGGHFKEIGDRFGSVDFAFLDSGQYNISWRNIHMNPEESLRAARDLNAKNFLPIHFAKFCISNHDWNEPLKVISEISRDTPPRILTPKIGEVVFLNDNEQTFSKWWE
ncbi:MAG: MBL fold metallo-hydrolase [Rickettsiales bacterium]|jgi:L-ascorbate metabolism protein UlaG (beta-lactamase superfamily)|nr:MBL fold metallo-hydrolase [Rickettsiales bacterium]